MSRYHQSITNCAVREFSHLTGSKLKEKVNRERKKMYFQALDTSKVQERNVGRHSKAVRVANVHENKEYMEISVQV